MKITLCDKVLNGDIPEYNIENKKEAEDLIYHWLKNKNYNKNVYVCFLSFKNVNYRDEQNTILISHCKDDIYVWVDYQLDFDNWNDLNLNIFEYGSYQDALEYCKDLKEAV